MSKQPRKDTGEKPIHEDVMKEEEEKEQRVSHGQSQHSRVIHQQALEVEHSISSGVNPSGSPLDSNLEIVSQIVGSTPRKDCHFNITAGLSMEPSKDSSGAIQDDQNLVSANLSVPSHDFSVDQQSEEKHKHQ